ncbi:MAG: TIR domain-containing protein [Flavobacteriales bacterium]|nr:TIR domain-containing protein [Flavobacteriales bacterium]MCC6939325.1 TIR domain-containing protein [Flavobacteriales bacterium]
MRCFVSFSSRDLPHVREVMTALAQQGIERWDYSDEIQHIEAGTVIGDRLRQEIDASDLIIAIVSSNSTDPAIGRFTHLELEYAIQQGKLDGDRIIPIRLSDAPNTGWPGCYGQLPDRLHLEFKLEDPESYVRMSADICLRAKVTYVPPIVAHHRLPFWKEFRDEVRDMAHSNHQHVGMMMVLGKFNEYHRLGRHENAYLMIQHFLSLCRYNLPKAAVFYPWLVKAVCELHNGLQQEAEKSLGVAGAIRPNDRNILALHAVLCEQRGDLERALDFRERSLKHANPENKRDEKINLAKALLSLGRALPRDLATFLHAVDVADMDARERAVVGTIQAMHLYAQGRTEEAYARYDAIERSGQPSATSIQMRSRCRFDAGDHKTGMSILTEGIRRAEKDPVIQPEPLWMELAQRHQQLSSPGEAIRICKDRLKEQLAPEWRIRYADLLVELGAQRDAEQASETVLKDLFPAELAPKFQLAAKANGILGRTDRARYDQERVRTPEELN